MHRERLPKPMTVKEFQEKFEKLAPGESFIYHTGALGEDRQRNKRLDSVARYALILGTDLGVETYMPNWEARSVDPERVGLGQAVLVQRRNCSGFEYSILKRSRQT